MIEQEIERKLLEWDEPIVELAVFGTKDPGEIADFIRSFCQEHLGSEAARCLLWSSSVGVAVGLQLEDSRRILLKCHQPNVGVAKLQAIERSRRVLEREGFPIPKLLLGPRPLASGSATVEDFVDAPYAVDGFVPENRRLIAQGLARMVNLLERYPAEEELGPFLLSPTPGGSLWPTPHSKLFDFEATREGAEWIDALARTAQEIIKQTDDKKVSAHVDWRVEHVRIRENKIITAFDWDSLSFDRESAAVGISAVHWPTDWSSHAPTVRKVPTVEESNVFVQEYIEARQRKFSREELRAIGAYRLYCLSYTARCGHSRDKQIQAGSPAEMLQRYGEGYLIVD